MSQADYQIFLIDVKERISQAQYRALKTVNYELVALYQDLGQLIVSKQETLGWGKSVVEQLAKDLQMAFPNSNGFSAANLWRCRNFYLAYYENPNLAAMLREIGWTHNVVIFEKCKDDLEREFYLLHVRKFGWTYRVLVHQIENKTYEKYLLKNKTVVEYSLSTGTHPIGVATYSLSNTLPEKYKHLLPSPELIAERFSHLKDLFTE